MTSQMIGLPGVCLRERRLPVSVVPDLLPFPS